VNVSNTDTLYAALKAAAPGHLIIMAPGTYHPTSHSSGFHHVEISNKMGTATQPIVLCGTRDAILDGGSTSGPTPVTIINSKYITVAGFTVQNGLKGISLQHTTSSIVDNVKVTNIGMEGIHIQDASSYNTIQHSWVINTGRRTPGKGEGVYLGSAESIKPNDHCVGNKVVNNTIGPGVTAEMVDVKENSSFGVVADNMLDGSSLCGCNSATSLINVKGNNYKVRRDRRCERSYVWILRTATFWSNFIAVWRQGVLLCTQLVAGSYQLTLPCVLQILNNVGKNSLQEMFKTSTTIPGQGVGNTFEGNKCITRLRSGYSCVSANTKWGGQGNSVIRSSS